MSDGLDWQTADELSREWPCGTRIRLTEMPDDPCPIAEGTEGTVTGHGPGQVWVRWDDGRTLNVLPGVDGWERVE